MVGQPSDTGSPVASPLGLLRALADEDAWDREAGRVLGRAHPPVVLSPPARQYRHLLAANRLAGQKGLELQAALHALSAGDLLSVDHTFELIVRTGLSLPDRALAEVSAALYERALDRLSHVHQPDPSTIAWLNLALHRALDESGDVRREAAYSESLRLIAELRDPHLAVELAGARLARRNNGDPRLRSLLLDALDWIEAADLHCRSFVGAFLALEMAEWVGGTRPVTLAIEALELARRVEDKEVLKVALRAYCASSFQLLTASERLPLVNEMLELAATTNDPDYELLALMNASIDHLGARNQREAEVFLDVVQDAAEKRFRPRFVALAQATRAAIHDVSGDAEACEASGVLAREALSPDAREDIEVALIGQDVLRHWRHGRLADYAELLEALWTNGSHAPIHCAALAAALAEKGFKQRAELLLRQEFGERLELIPQGTLHLATVALSSVAVAAIGNRPLARSLLAQLTAHRGTDVVAGGAGGVLGPVETFTGVLQALLGNDDESRGDLEAARRSCEAAGYSDLAVRLGVLLGTTST